MKKKKPTLKDKLSTLELENKILKAKIEAYEKSLELIGLNSNIKTYITPYTPPLTDPNPYKPYTPYWSVLPKTYCNSDKYSMSPEEFKESYYGHCTTETSKNQVK